MKFVVAWKWGEWASTTQPELAVHHEVALERQLGQGQVMDLGLGIVYQEAHASVLLQDAEGVALPVLRPTAFVPLLEILGQQYRAFRLVGCDDRRGRGFREAR